MTGKLGGRDCRILTKSREMGDFCAFRPAKSHIAVQHFVGQNVE
jgi:hypothetical protein